ncbi:uncharacterized protein LOC116301912 [Actinia tenebrosa]|uniref:Uncharacterized protein LOC116301912 n=1 Tax=Actinia tenebrosa TaxID=6105 RepID=A0A6P8IJM4_ACTTE|nr:uncharacterized protein LOC116301912 [Actinia tenebrosa]
MDSNGSHQNLGLHYEGVLEKAGKRFFEGFRKRWFILEGKDLSYYKAPETTEQNLLGIIDMTRVKSVVPFKMINNSFQINTSTRTYTFTAPSSQSLTEWISVLRQAMQLESFSNKRARSSIRESVSEDGYEVVVSRSSRSDSKASSTSQRSFEDNDVYGDENVYDKIESSGSQSKADNKLEDEAAGSYESVGSFKRKNLQNKNNKPEVSGYGMVARQGSLPRNDQGSGVSEIGAYDVIGGTYEAEVQNEGNLYSQVKKPIASPPFEVTDSLYAEVENAGSIANSVSTGKSSKPNITVSNPMPVLVESDDDEEDEDESDARDTLEVKNNGLSKDPLPPPVGSIYAADEIKSLLQEIDGDVDEKSQEIKQISYKDDLLIPESCENAFSELKKFLVYLEATER